MLKMSLSELADFHKWLMWKCYKRVIDYEHPQDITEKFHQLLIYDAQPYKTRLADKYLVRDYVRERVGEKYLIRLLGVWERFEDIDFDSLPSAFVLKTNHASGTNLVVKDKSKLDKKAAAAKFGRWMSFNFGATERCELHYRGIKPLIIAEEYLTPSSHDLVDYKFYCVLGQPALIRIIYNRDFEKNRADGLCIDRNGTIIPMTDDKPLSELHDIPFPENREEMLDVAEKLSRGIDFVRVDMYNFDGKVYFGEMTFTPSAFEDGIVWYPENWELLNEEQKAYARTGIPEQVTQL